MNKRQLLRAKDADFCLVSEPIPKAPPKGAVVKLLYSGLCYSDAHNWKHGSIRTTFSYPVVLGHEMAGIVHELGSENVEDAAPLKVGDKVAVFPWAGCLECVFCKDNRDTQCQRCLDYSYGAVQDGGFQEYVILYNKKLLLPVPEGLPMESAALLCCSGLTPFNALKKLRSKTADIIKMTGSCTLLFVGAGGLGLWAVNLAKLVLGNKIKVVVADVSEEKVSGARAAGADDTVVWDPKADDDEVVKRTLKVTGGPVHGCIDFVNVQQTTNRLMKCVHQAATYVMVGLMGSVQEIAIRPIVGRSLRVIGSYTGDRLQLQELLKVAADNKLKGPPVAFIKLEDVQPTLIKLQNGKMTGRAIIKFE